MIKPITLNNRHKIAPMGLGTWRSVKGQVGEAVEYAINEVGYRHIDCASIYGNEKEIGQAFHRVFSGEVKRGDVFITSKLWNTDHHPDHVEAACRKTLKDLQLEYLDLYLMHWGVAFKHGRVMEPLSKLGVAITQPVSIQETWRAMERLVKKGLVKSIGVANFTTMMLVDLLTYAQVKPVMDQIELHPYNTQESLIKYCQSNDITVTAYSPLGSAKGPNWMGHGGLDLLTDSVIAEIGEAHEATSAQVLIAWAMSRGTIPIPKSTNKERIAQNFAAQKLKLTKKEVAAISALNKNKRFVDPIGWWGIPYFE